MESEIAAHDEKCGPPAKAIATWLEDFRRCERDVDCEVADIAAKCAPAFLCSTALSTNIDRVALARGSAAKAAEFRTNCGCFLADCSGAHTLAAFCDPVTKLCDLKPAWSVPPNTTCKANDQGVVVCQPVPGTGNDPQVVDAGKADAATNDAGAQDASVAPDAGAGSGGDAGVDRFACKVSADCAIKNVGNCCGAYPRCANKAAVFTPPQCEPGLSGVCGYPAIEECTCRDNTCRSLQGGKEI